MSEKSEAKTDEIKQNVADIAARGVEPRAKAAEYVAEMRAARGAGVRWRRTARWLGLAIFLFGAGLLAYVFWTALGGLQQFAQPDYLSNRINLNPGSSTASIVQTTVGVFGSEFLRVIYLLILGFVASAIAARGIQFFAASESVIDEAVVPEE